MRLKEYLREYEYAPIDESGGRFEYLSQYDSENHRTLQGLIKNNGVFKSMKQRWYLLEKRWNQDKVGKGKTRSVSASKRHFGIKVNDGDYLVSVNASMTFGHRGRGQGTRRLEWFYVLDDAGVREKYKLGFTYSEGGEASAPDPKKTKLEWKRQNNDQVKNFLEDVAQEKLQRDAKIKAGEAKLKASKHIGVIGERLKDIEVEVIRKHFFETQFGESAITVMKDNEGNMIQHFGRNNLKKGDKKTVDFTVKNHEVAEVNKWNKVPYKFTSVQRVKAK